MAAVAAPVPRIFNVSTVSGTGYPIGAVPAIVIPGLSLKRARRFAERRASRSGRRNHAVPEDAAGRRDETE